MRKRFDIVNFRTQKNVTQVQKRTSTKKQQKKTGSSQTAETLSRVQHHSIKVIWHNALASCTMISLARLSA